MITLHIEHPISAYETWKAAFDRFASARHDAGVRRHVVSRPTDDADFIVVDLTFDDEGRATEFLGFLRERVWAVPANSPGLAGEPQTRILRVEETRGH